MAEQQQRPPATLPVQARPNSAIYKPVAGAIEVSRTSGMMVRDVGQAMEVAKLMSISGSAVPAHVRNNAGTCLAVAIQAWEWSMNPFAVANKSYVVNDRLAYESALYNAVATRRAPIVGRLMISYSGDGADRRCKVSAKLRMDEGGGIVDYESPKFGAINPKNSPLWKNDPDQQLFYFSVRAFVRRHFPDVMMGVYTVDELQDDGDMPPARPRREVAAIDVSSVLGKATETTSAPGGTADTALKPTPAEPAPAETVNQETGEVEPVVPQEAQEAHQQPATASDPSIPSEEEQEAIRRREEAEAQILTPPKLRMK